MLEQLFQRYPALDVCRASIEQAIDLLEKTAHGQGTVLLCGNGGSCADCDHISGELMKGFLQRRPLEQADREKLERAFPAEGEWIANKLQRAVRAISLPAQTAVGTAFANDVDPDLVYGQLVYGYGRPGDVVVGISTSGNAPNVVNAMKVAKSMGFATIGLTGGAPCSLDGLCQVVIHAPASQTFAVQEYHLPIYHALCAELEQRLFGS